MGDPSTFRIEELTGGGHTLTLQGRALPYRPLTFESSMRAEFTWYPGNPVATVQMLGSKEETTSVNGMWKDKFIGSLTDNAILPAPVIPTAIAKFDGVQLAGASDVVRVVDKLRRRGQLLQVTWDELIRHGILTKFKHTWLRHEDIEWDMEFTWISQGDPLLPVAFGFTVPALDLVSGLIDSMNTLKGLLAAPFALVSGVQGLISNALDDIDIAVSGISKAASSLSKAVLSPLETARNIIAGIKSVQEGLLRIESAIVSVPARALKQVQDIQELGQEEVLLASSYARVARKASRDLRAKLARQADELEAQNVQQEVVQVFTAREGQDLREVSSQFYGTPDQWRSIANFNRIHGSKLVAGQVINVPRVSNT